MAKPHDVVFGSDLFILPIIISWSSAAKMHLSLKKKKKRETLNDVAIHVLPTLSIKIIIQTPMT